MSAATIVLCRRIASRPHPPCSGSAGIRVLGLLRLWRLLRLMNTMLAKKDEEIERTNDLWQADQEALETSRLEVIRLEDSVRREIDSKKRIELMLKSYKDEVRA